MKEQTVKFIAIRQGHAKVIGSRVMTEYEAGREVAAWRDDIGPACYVPATSDVRSMVRRDDTEALAEILYCKLGGYTRPEQTRQGETR